jgi:dCTP diphosphatase
VSTDNKSGPTDRLNELREALRRFATERDWDQFHSPKNLAIALSVEASELLEHFQWTPDTDSAALTPEKRAKVTEELADVLLYLIRLADKLGVDLPNAAIEKMKKNAAKYPIDKSRGSSKKYSDL